MPTTLDWSRSDPNSWANYPVAMATMSGLTTVGPANDVRPGLAERWDRQCCPGGREVYTFHLRPDARWSDGTTALSAADFVLGWRRAVQGRERGDMLDLLGADRVLKLLDQGAPAAAIQSAVNSLGVEAVDPQTLRVTLAAPKNYFLSRVANVYLFFPAPSSVLAGRSEEEIREYFDRPRAGHPMSVGPFRVEDWDRAGERLRLVRNGHSAFSSRREAGETAAEVLTLLKSEVGTALYDRGRVDFIFVDSPVELQQNRGADLHRQELLSTYFLVFNTERSPLDRVELRRALAASIDRAALLDRLLPSARLAFTLLPPGLLGAGLPRPVARLAPSSAREIVERQGGASRPLRLVYRAGESFIPEVAIAERIKAQFAAIGVRVELDPRYDFFTEIARIAADGHPAPDMYLRRLGADYAHPKTFFTLFERGGNHHSGWERIDQGNAVERFEALIREGDALPDVALAAPLYARAESVLLDEAAVIAPLYHPDRYYRLRPKLVGLRVDAFNFLSFRELRIKSANSSGQGGRR
jgi:peptide/nickel transport system substrate-binding protein